MNMNIVSNIAKLIVLITIYCAVLAGCYATMDNYCSTVKLIIKRVLVAIVVAIIYVSLVAVCVIGATETTGKKGTVVVPMPLILR